MSANRKGALGPAVLGFALLVFACIAWVFTWARVDLAWVPCNGTFALSAENARCRWPAIYSYLGLACFAGALLAFLIALVRKVRRTNEHATNK